MGSRNPIATGGPLLLDQYEKEPDPLGAAPFDAERMEPSQPFRPCVRRKGEVWYEHRFLPKIGPVALWGLLFTVVVLFALQGKAITSRPLDVVRIATPLLAYFGLMWAISFAIGWRLRLSYRSNTTMAFTAASNNFELAIAVAIGVFGAASGEALAGVVGPLIEVPVLVGLVYVALWLRRRLYSMPEARRGGAAPRSGESLIPAATRQGGRDGMP